MRLTLVLLVGALCLALSYALPLDDDDNVQDNGQITLLDLADQPEGHANEGDREARAFCCGGGFGRRRGYGGYGGYGRGGFGYGGYGRGGYGGGYGGYGRGGFGHGGHRRGGYGHRGGYGFYGR
ncbi:keratin-associated protein 19-2-like [Drosophila montana]|uniref:keratin-associated protein 19-2-like n=1 Tax=Drosophila montana TaxID=40370 RepID=UPI00313DAACC